MNPTLRNVATILPALLRNAIPKPSGPGYVLELEGAELDALRELADYLKAPEALRKTLGRMCSLDGHESVCKEIVAWMNQITVEANWRFAAKVAERATELDATR